MANFGIFCPPLPGHLNPLAAVGRVLRRRGHRVTVFGIPDLGSRVKEHGLEFAVLGETQFAAGALSENTAQLARLQGLASLRFAVSCAQRLTDAILRDGPGVVSGAAVDVLLVDQNEPAGASVAQRLQLPFLSTCAGLPLNRELHIPPPYVGWTHSRSLPAKLRNAVAYYLSDCLVAPIPNTLNAYRKNWGLPLLRSPDDSFSHTAQLTQMIAAFEFPRDRPVENMHHLGPWFYEHGFDDGASGENGFDDHHAAKLFPYERLDGRPLIYGSLGTLQDSHSNLFRTMAEACVGLNAQLVLALGRPEAPTRLTLPGNPIVVPYAPQLKLLSRAAAAITHAGMNTTQQALRFGVPLVAIPLTHDQPATAARLAHTGAGVVLPPKRLTADRLRQTLHRILPGDSPVRHAAQRLRPAYEAAGGATRAAEIAEAHLDGPKHCGNNGRTALGTGGGNSRA